MNHRITFNGRQAINKIRQRLANKTERGILSGQLEAAFYEFIKIGLERNSGFPWIEYTLTLYYFYRRIDDLHVFLFLHTYTWQI